MSDYATPFADKLLDDKTFDTIFGGEVDDQLMGAVLKENDTFNDDHVETDSIEDDLGAIGKGDGLGSDLGPGHDTTGGMKPTDDSSDQEILGKVDSYQQKHVIDSSKSDPTQKSADGVCDRHIEDETDKLKNSVDSFEDAYSNLLKELAEEEYGDVEGQDMTAGDPAPVGTPAEEPNYAVPEEDPERDLVDALEDEDNDPISVMVGEEADEYVETRDFESVGDKGEDNLGDDLGPDNDTTGGMKPTDDSSDEDIIAAVAGKELKDGQLNAGDNACGKIEDGDNINPADARVAGDTADAASDSFSEAEEIEAAVAGKELPKKPQQNEKDSAQNEAADLEDGSTTEAEEDSIVDSVEEKDPKPEFAVDELNEDEDDEIMNAVMGGRA